MTAMTRPSRPHARPSWFATASQKVRAGSDHPAPGSFVPWGVVHGRRLGSPTTACGTPCLTWPVFFDVDIRHESAMDVCADCRRIAAAERPVDRPAAEW